ncbi:MAG: bifunctional FO biosynthesis protein CofGH [Nitriliruptoraceae bacterium]
MVNAQSSDATSPGPTLPPDADTATLDRRRPRALRRAADGRSLTSEEIEALLASRGDDLAQLLAIAGHVRDRAPWYRQSDADSAGEHRRHITYSRKVFVPLTHLCRDTCGYCTFAWPPKADVPAFLAPDAVLEIARRGQQAGCREVLFTLGDRPETRYPAARQWLDARGYDTTLEYLRAVAIEVIEATGMLPHLNPGVMSWSEMSTLKHVAGSMGLMLESVSPRLMQRGQAHAGAPDKNPQTRLKMLEDAGRLSIPFTSGMLIGIGETLDERADTLLALRATHRRYGHLQEVIIQPFRAKPATAMSAWPEPSMDDLLACVATARVVLGPTVHLQAPPNLAASDYPRILEAGIDDWGGVSPVTVDHVNPEAPWPALDELTQRTNDAGFALVERLCVYPEYVTTPDPWISTRMRPAINAVADHRGYADVKVLPRPQQWQESDADAAMFVQQPRQRIAAVLDDDAVDGAAAFGSAADGGAARSARAQDAVHRAVYGDIDEVVAATPWSSFRPDDLSDGFPDDPSNGPSNDPADGLGDDLSDVQTEDGGVGGDVGYNVALRDEAAVAAGDAQPTSINRSHQLTREIAAILGRAARGVVLDDREALRLFETSGAELDALGAVADELRVTAVGDTVTYVVNRNINFTNICYTGCRFCAFAQRRDDPDAYNLSLAQIADRAADAQAVGATEVCLQGGIHPDLPGDYYFDILDAVRARTPDMHIHAFSPMEVVNGASRLGISVREWLQEAHRRGLGSMPGTAAEILDDEVRWVLTKGKLPADQWIDVITTAHEIGLPSSSTMMYGHVDHPRHWVNHLKTLRGLQERTYGFTEFVPLPFVHQFAPIYLAGVARPGSRWDEDRQVHAVARILLHGVIDHIQVSWVKIGLDRAAQILQQGADDLGGTLMEETISRMAGSRHGVRQSTDSLVATAASIGRSAAQRTTTYARVTAARQTATGGMQ